MDDSPLAMVDASTVEPKDLLNYVIHFPGLSVLHAYHGKLARCGDYACTSSILHQCSILDHEAGIKAGWI